MKAKDLKQDSNNYRKHSDTNKKRIKKSIDENGLGRSVLVDADGVLIAGNGVASVVDKDTKVRVVETVCKAGDIWRLGDHRLMCGDSTDAGSVAMLMDGERAVLLLTDPPYGISVVSKDGSVWGENLCAVGVYSPVIGDETTETAQKSFEVGRQFTNKQIIFGGNYFTEFLPQSDGWLIWDKGGESGIRNNFADGEMAWCSFHTPVRIYHQLWAGMIKQDEHEKRLHPTQKPVRMLSEIMTDFSTDEDSILDLFGGSGSTLIAAEQLNRRCYMMELDPHYCDVIIARWEKLTGRKAEKVCNVNEQ